MITNKNIIQFEVPAFNIWLSNLILYQFKLYVYKSNNQTRNRIKKIKF